MSNQYFPSSSPDEMNEKPKMSADQESALDMHFNRNKTMHASDVAILSAETGLSEEQVQVYYYLPSPFSSSFDYRHLLLAYLLPIK